ncbi:MAG: hypothetical protein AAGA62_19995 [Bacteroidota bacterium]
MRNFTYLLIFLFLASTLAGQTVLYDANAGLPKRVLRTSLAHLADPIVMGPTFNYENVVRPGVFIRREVGLMLPYGAYSSRVVNELFGFRARTTRRKYPRAKLSQKAYFYHEWSFDFRYLTANLTGEFSLGPPTSSITTEVDYGITQHSLSTSYHVGVVFLLGERLQLDIGAGIGGRLNYRNYHGVPEGISFIPDSNFFWQYGTRNPFHPTITAPLIFALGYHL